jgi:hypothetical protein
VRFEHESAFRTVNELPQEPQQFATEPQTIHRNLDVWSRFDDIIWKPQIVIPRMEDPAGQPPKIQTDPIPAGLLHCHRRVTSYIPRRATEPRECGNEPGISSDRLHLGSGPGDRSLSDRAAAAPRRTRLVSLRRCGARVAVLVKEFPIIRERKSLSRMLVNYRCLLCGYFVGVDTRVCPKCKKAITPSAD